MAFPTVEAVRVEVRRRELPGVRVLTDESFDPHKERLDDHR
jgi:hypothetical protein